MSSFIKIFILICAITNYAIILLFALVATIVNQQTKWVSWYNFNIFRGHLWLKNFYFNQTWPIKELIFWRCNVRISKLLLDFGSQFSCWTLLWKLQRKAKSRERRCQNDLLVLILQNEVLSFQLLINSVMGFTPLLV